MRTNIVIDDKLMSLALKTTGLKTKKEVVEEGLKVLIDYFNGASSWQVEALDSLERNMLQLGIMS